MFNYFSLTDSIICPDCMIKAVKLENDDSISNYEHKEIICPRCSIKFTFVFCAHCGQKIYMLKVRDSDPINNLNGFNLKCPYVNCKKIFCITKCPKCNKVEKIKKFVKEGTVLTCSSITCETKYFQVRCPIRGCREVIYFLYNKKQWSNHPIGVLANHLKEIIFQKIYCPFCEKPIVYLSNQTTKNRYFEGQLVVCPYKECGRKFNRIICPNPECLEEIIYENGWYSLGTLIKCKSCSLGFGKLICPKCVKTCVLKKSFIRFGAMNMKCGFKSCAKESYIINCIYCRRINYFTDSTPVPGQIIKCGYSDCGKMFNEVNCPACGEANPFPKADFAFGKRYRCMYLTCAKNFILFICPKCNTYSPKIDANEGQKLKCSECGNMLLNFGCPFCKLTIMDADSNIRIGQFVRCPNKSCNKVFCFVRCGECHRLIFSNEKEPLIGRCIQCPFNDCRKYSLTIECLLCHKRVIISGQCEDIKNGDDVHCHNCGKSFMFDLNLYYSNDMIYEKSLSFLKGVIGKGISFGNPNVDENFCEMSMIVIGRENIYTHPSQAMTNESSNIGESLTIAFPKKEEPKPVMECIVCKNNPKESVFIPCGHRCVCYTCAAMIQRVQKRCPYCGIITRNIIRKIFD